MLVATPANQVDRKPRVISEIRKPFVQRSPSLDDLPRLSGTLNYYCNILGIWSQKQVCVRDGCLLVYQDTPTFLQTPIRGYASLGRLAGRRTPLQHTRSESSGSANSIDYFAYSGSQSLGRARGAALAGLEFRLPLRHLNLMPSTLAPLAFTISHLQNGCTDASQVTFQALNELDYDRWVKTLAVEILRQTPLEAIRFLDVLGIASLSTPSNKSCRETSYLATKYMTEGKHKNLLKSNSQTIIRWDRSPSSEGSTTSTDFSAQENKYHLTNKLISAKAKRLSINGNHLPRRKLHMKENLDVMDSPIDKTSVINRNEIHTPLCTKIINSSRKSREKVRRSRDKNGNGSSSEEARTIDEGIVLEERGSSSERSCRRTLWPSDRSDCLDSPHSVSSYSSYEMCESPETASIGDDLHSNDETNLNKVVSVDEPDCKIKESNHEAMTERIYCKNIVSPRTLQKNFLQKKCDKKVALVKTMSEGKRLFLEGMSNDNNQITNSLSLMEIPLFRAQPYYNVQDTNNMVKENTNFKSRTDSNKENFIIDSHNNTTNPTYNVEGNFKETWNRARSCSPNNRSLECKNRELRALSVGQPATKIHFCVEILKERCQNTENYVTVKEKLALFESICHASRLARSSEELTGDSLESIALRTRSLHDLTRERSPHVRDICQFFEKFGQSKPSLIHKNQNDDTNTETKKRRYSENYSTQTFKSSDSKILLKSKSNISINHKEVYSEKPKPYLSYLNCNNNHTMKYKVRPYQIIEENSDNVSKNKNYHDSIDGVNMKIQNDTSLCDAFQYGRFKQIRLGNKIITYV